MKDKSGFIATSLIYTFFLAFIAILTALLSNYLANKTILDRYNGDVQSKLNNGNGSVSLYVTYASIDNGKTITNLVRNGNFSDDFNNWNIQNGGNFQVIDFEKKCVIKTGSNGNLSQPINIVADHDYYFRMEYYQPSLGYTTDVFVSNSETGDIIDSESVISSSNSDGWKSTSRIVTLRGLDSLSYLIVGKQSVYNTSRTYYTNLLLMDVSYSFNGEVSKEWLDANIDYFEGTVSYISKDFTDSEELSFNIVPYAGYTLGDVKCDYDDFEISPVTNEANTKYLFKARNNSHKNKCVINFIYNMEES